MHARYRSTDKISARFGGSVGNITLSFRMIFPLVNTHSFYSRLLPRVDRRHGAQKPILMKISEFQLPVRPETRFSTETQATSTRTDVECRESAMARSIFSYTYVVFYNKIAIKTLSVDSLLESDGGGREDDNSSRVHRQNDFTSPKSLFSSLYLCTHTSMFSPTHTRN